MTKKRVSSRNCMRDMVPMPPLITLNAEAASRYGKVAFPSHSSLHQQQH